MIDLNKLYNRDTNYIDISGEYELPEEYITDKRIKKIDKIYVEGDIKLQTDEEEDVLYVKCKIETNVVLEDSISLKDVNYKVNIEYDDYLENYKNNENRLDIFAFLWENIELEIPMRYTEEKDLTKFSGKDWKLISEDELDQ